MSSSPSPNDPPSDNVSFDSSDSEIIFVQGEVDTTVRPSRPELRRWREERAKLNPPVSSDKVSSDDSDSEIIFVAGDVDTTVRPSRPELRRWREERAKLNPPALPADPLKPKEGEG